MSDLIKRSDVMDALKRRFYDETYAAYSEATVLTEHSAFWDHKTVLKVIEDAPTFDAVEVVMCKDCKYRETCEQIVWFDIGKHEAIGSEIDFCSYGERSKR